jgi:hypothetical protein
MWPRFISIIVSVWLTASADVLGFDGAAKTNSVICGALASTFVTVAIWETTRGLRWLNCAIGVWLSISLAVLRYELPALFSNLAVGIVLISSSLIKGGIKGKTAGGWRSLWERP